MSYGDSQNSISIAQQIDRICDDFEQQLQRMANPKIEEFLVRISEVGQVPLLKELLALEIDYLRSQNVDPDSKNYLQRFAQLSEATLRDILARTVSVPNDLVPGLQTVPTATTGQQESATGRGAPKRLHYFGDYLLLEKIARGGMGTVFLARQVSLNRLVAVKMISSGQFASQVEIQRFQTEAKSAARLFHPNIIPVYEVGENGGNHFYSMAYVDGVSLSQKLSEGPLEPRQAAHLLLTISLAVQFAHEQGVVHRDLKPSNIMLDRQDIPLVGDFGLARSISEDTRLTVSGDVLGTPSFMPPEQASGHLVSITFASDVYSLGAILYNCLSGRPPFQAASHVATLKQVLENDAVPLRQLNAAVPSDLETIVHKCLQKALAKRYSSARDLADDLGNFLAGRPITARPIGSVERAIRWCRRHPSQAVNLSLAIFLLIGSILGWVLFQAREKQLAAQSDAESLVQQLSVASQDDLPLIAQKIRSNRLAMGLIDDPKSHQDIVASSSDRVSLVLFPSKDSEIDAACNYWLESTWTEWLWIRDDMESRKGLARRWLHRLDLDRIRKLSDSSMLRLLAIEQFLAPTEPHPNWPMDIVERLESDDRLAAGLLEELRRDTRQVLPAVQALNTLRDRLAISMAKQLDYRSLKLQPDAPIAAQFLAYSFSNNPKKLFEFMWNARAEALPLLFEQTPVTPDHIEFYAEVLRTSIESKSWDDRTRISRQRALAGALLVQANRLDLVSPSLQFAENPSTRCLIADWIPLFLRDPSLLMDRVEELIKNRPAHVATILASENSSKTIGNPWVRDPTSSELRMLIQTLGRYSSSWIGSAKQELLISLLGELFRSDPDPGLRASCEWYFRRVGRADLVNSIDQDRRNQSNDASGWRVNSNGHVMITLQGPFQYTAGSELDDPDRDAGAPVDVYTGQVLPWSEDHPYPKQIPRSFEISMHETRLDQVHQFDPNFHDRQNKDLGPSKEHPACKVTWFKAAEYCNLLSHAEGIPSEQWCFIPNEQGNYGVGMRLAPDYLHRTGYRLPTEAEWEYACRAQTRSARYFGDTPELIGSYVWYMRNSEERSLSIPGTLLPNDFGLFDMLGNVKEWCIDPFDLRFPGSRFRLDDQEVVVEAQENYIVRGGSIYEVPKEIRSSEYSNFAPTYRNGDIGFRVARTLQ